MSTAVLSPCAPLTVAETRAALKAVGRVLDLAAEPAPPAAVADALHAARTLPELLARPDDFRDRFRPTLQRLARKHRRFGEALHVFDEGTDRHPDLWRDCGEAD